MGVARLSPLLPQLRLVSATLRSSSLVVRTAWVPVGTIAVRSITVRSIMVRSIIVRNMMVRPGLAVIRYWLQPVWYPVAVVQLCVVLTKSK